MLLSISYDLRQPGRNYNDLYDTIKSASAWCHAMESLWFIHTNESVNTWAERLRKVIDQNDYLFVVDITKQSRGGWLRKDVWEWLDKHDS